ncbi:MAG: HDOD domain-containing protein [Chitinivorax sp.]
MKLEAVFDHIGQLPTVPSVVQELIASFDRDDIDVASLATKVSKDQVISAKVLRLANTAHFGSPRQISSIEDAVIVLGFDKLRTLVIASGIAGMAIPIPAFDKVHYWRYSLNVANTAKLLAKMARHNGEVAFTAGLLHSIGQLLIHIAAPADAAAVEKLVASGASRTASEMNTFGFNHAEVGAELARRWNFPQLIQDAIRYHNEPLKQEPFQPMAALVHLGEYIIHHLEMGDEPSELIGNIPLALTDKLTLNLDRIAESLDGIREQMGSWDSLIHS